VLLGESRRGSGHSATTARATMMPTETSRNLCSAMVYAEADRGMRTIIQSVMPASWYAVFSKTNRDRQQSDENDRKREGKQICPEVIYLERSN
jgi:hypothetical protein